MPLQPFASQQKLLIQSAVKNIRSYVMAPNTNKQVQAHGKPNPKIIIFPPKMYWPSHQHPPISDTTNLYEAFYPLAPQSPRSFRAGQQVHVKPPEKAFAVSCM